MLRVFTDVGKAFEAAGSPGDKRPFLIIPVDVNPGVRKNELGDWKSTIFCSDLQKVASFLEVHKLL